VTNPFVRIKYINKITRHHRLGINFSHIHIRVSIVDNKFGVYNRREVFTTITKRQRRDLAEIASSDQFLMKMKSKSANYAKSRKIDGSALAGSERNFRVAADTEDSPERFIPLPLVRTRVSAGGGGVKEDTRVVSP